MYELLHTDAPRRGGWWLRLTAPQGAGQYDHAPNRPERERLRHAQLTSYVAPFVFLAPLLLLQQASGNIETSASIVVLMGISMLALVFNRLGQQVVAAILLILAMDAVIEGSLLTAGALGSGWLLTFDLFVIPLIAVGVLLNRRFILLFMFLHIAFILGDFYLLPHATDLTALITLWHGPAIAFARPVIVQLGSGLLCWLAVRSADEAILRADRAEFVANLQESIAVEKQQLEEGIQELVRVLTEMSNGRAAQPSLPKESKLWRIGQAIEVLFARWQSGKITEQRAQQLVRDIQILTSFVHAARSGQQVQWPAAPGNLLDPLVREIALLDQQRKGDAAGSW